MSPWIRACICANQDQSPFRTGLAPLRHKRSGAIGMFRLDSEYDLWTSRRKGA